MDKPRRFASFFDDDFDPFADMEQLHGLFDELMRHGLDQSNAKPGQPLVYGVSMHVGPDGKPHVEQFGNVRQGKITNEREPLVDVVDLEDEVRVLAELPGVAKKDLHMSAKDNVLHIEVTDSQRPFSKDVRLPKSAEEKTAKASIQNGILEVVFKKKIRTTRDEIPVK